MGGFLCPISSVQNIFLIYLVLRVLITNEVILSGYTPFNSLFSFGGNTLSIVLTIIFALTSIFIYRPFCKYLCPLGAWLGLCSIFSRNNLITEKCVSCDLCKKDCDIEAISKGVINKKECIMCGKCSDNCKILKR
jgi:polyferredoxin